MQHRNLLPRHGVQRQPAQSDLAATVLGAQDLPWLDRALPQVMQDALLREDCAKRPWLNAIYELWGERWVPKMGFGLQARMDKRERIRLDEEQFAVLQGLTENTSVLVTGAAGTGKNALTLALARKLAESGKSVLLLCFTDALAGWLRTQIDQPNPAVWAITSYAVELLRQTGRDVAVAVA